MAVRFTDVMLRVRNLAVAVQALEGTLGFSQVQSGDGWIALTDPIGTVRIVLTAGDFGSNWALGCAQETSEDTYSQFGDWNTTQLASLSENGFALLTHEAGLFVVIYD